MPVYGLRPDDVVVDTAGNVQTGATLTLHATQADAQAAVSPLATVTTSAGRWSADVSTVPVWVRTPNGAVYEIADFSAKADKTYVDAAFVAKDARVLNVKNYGAKGDGTANDTAAINSALNALTPGDTLIFPPGRYLTDGGHVISKPSVKIVGPTGRAQTYNSSAQLYLRNGANVDMLTITANQVTIRDLSLYGNYNNQTATSRGVVTPSTAAPSYLLLDAVWVDSFNGDGYSFESSGGTLSSTITNCESRKNVGYGMRFYGTATDSMVSNCYIDQNTQSGVHCSAGDLSMTSCHIWGNGTAGTGDVDGITFQSSSGCRLVNCYIETQVNGVGIRFKTGANKGHIITECDIWANGFQGIYGFNASNCVISNNVIRQNNYKGGTGVAGAGLALDTCTAISITGNQFFSTGATRQTYGYYEIGSANVDIRFEGNMSRAADHTTGGVFLGPNTKASLGEVFRRKIADQSVTSSTTLVDDADLQFPVVAGEVWEIEGLLFADGAQTGDLSLRLSSPTGQSGFWQALGPNASASAATATSIVPTGNPFNTGVTVGLLGAGTATAVQVRGLLTVGTAGTVKAQFAQGTSDATPTTLKAGSYLRARRVAQ